MPLFGIPFLGPGYLQNNKKLKYRKFVGMDFWVGLLKKDKQTTFLYGSYRLKCSRMIGLSDVALRYRACLA